MATQLGVHAQATDRALIVQVSGTLDGTPTDANSLIDAATTTNPPHLVIFDLRGVGLLTAAGVRSLNVAIDALHSRQVACRLVIDPDSPEAAVLQLAPLPPTVTGYDTIDAALAPPDPPGTGDDQGLSAQFATLTRALVADTTVGAVLHRVVTAALTIVPGADLVSVTLRDANGSFDTPVHTDPVASELDDVQYRSGQGPCIDAARPDGPAYAASDDLAVETRWPAFTHAATDNGLAAVLSTDLIPTLQPAIPGGALNIYSRHPHGLRAADRHAALLLASHAALALAHTRSSELADLHTQRLHRAIETRDVIGQAKGILMARRGMTADEAFDVLRRTSQDLNMKLVDLARTLTEHPDGLDTPGD